MRNISTDNLYHYTRKFDWILSIIENGFKFKRCEEDLPLTGFSSSVFSFPGIIKYSIYPEVICFCDIPFNLISDHINQYGEYCIGLTKDWGMFNGITPIRYVHYYTPDLRDDTFYALRSCAEYFSQFDNSMLLMINKMLIEMNNFNGITEKDIAKLPNKWRQVIAQMDCEFIEMIKFTQTYIGNMRSYEGDWIDRVTGVKTKRSFYDEREWRALKTSEKQTHLVFDWNDVTEIILKDKKEQLQIIEFLHDKYEIDYDSAKNKIKFISSVIKSNNRNI